MYQVRPVAQMDEEGGKVAQLPAAGNRARPVIFVRQWWGDS
jgi:hypothetical protein